MLFLTKAILKAAGFRYDQIEDTWIVPVPPRPVVTVEHDQDRRYITEALLDAHGVLQANGYSYTNFSINGRFVSIVGLTRERVVAAA
jgi:hypothetical protein